MSSLESIVEVVQIRERQGKRAAWIETVLMKDACFTRLATLRAILFDLDDTLIDRGGAQRRYLEQIVSPAHLSPGADVRETIEAIVAVDERGRGSLEVFASVAVSRLPGLGWSTERFLSDYLANFGTFVRPHEWIVPLLRAIRRRYRIAIVTNGQAHTQRLKIESAGLEREFDAIVISGEVGVDKPDPAIFNAALRALSVSAEEAMHVGDNELTDIVGAHGAGIMTCWVSGGVDYPADVPRPDIVVESVAELPRILHLAAVDV